MKEWPTRVRTARAPVSAMTSGTWAEQMTLWTIATSDAVAPCATARATSRRAMRAVMALGLTGSPRSSTTKQRSASPSKANPRSAPCSTTAACRSTRFFGSSGFASWFGKVPSSSKYSGTIVSGSAGSPAPASSTAGTVNPPIPFPASTTTRSGRMPDRSTSPRRNDA